MQTSRISTVVIPLVCSWILGCQDQVPEAAAPGAEAETEAEIDVAAGDSPSAPASAGGPGEDAANPLARGASLVAIARQVPPDALALRRQALSRAGRMGHDLDRPEDFYLAVHRRELGKPWFLSAYLSELLTTSFHGGGYSLGTRVVSFELQNDRLYVFDVDARKRTSDLFDPSVIIEAYPVVHGFEPFERRPGARDYILIDPASGLNRFSLLNDMFEADPGAMRFSVDLSYLRRFRQIADGITYEQVFTGYTDASQTAPESRIPFETNAFRASGVMGMSLRRYRSSPGFVETSLPAQEHFFRSEPRAVPNAGTTEQRAVHWHIHPGMEPIEWVISPALAALDASPEYRDVDVVESVRRGVTWWNQAFGFPVFTARLAEVNEPLAVDDKNFILFDPNPEVGYAFAQFRTNPNTGEIYGASVYVSGVFLAMPEDNDEEEAGEAGKGGSADALLPVPMVREGAAMPGLRWGGFDATPVCALSASEYHAHQTAGLDEELGADLGGDPGEATRALSPAEKLERSLTVLIAHEIGHTLGLRHNFKGSLVPPSSSVMDYLGLVGTSMTGPGPYDVAAVRYLHGMDSSLPAEPFCTDEQTVRDPACMAYDWGADPLGESALPGYEYMMSFVLAGGLSGRELAFDYYSRGVRGYVQGGGAEDALRGWEALIEPVRVRAATENLADEPGYGAVADAVTRRILALLFVEKGAFDVITKPPSNPAVMTSILAELEANLLNEDGVRSFQTRRLCVDILKQMQTLPAYRVLLDARDELAAAVERGDDAGDTPDSALDPDERALRLDLLARIDRAISPYFVNP